MTLKKKLTLFLIAILTSAISYAGTITVISNADSGPGTLRDAINQSNANGTGIVDNIIFNIADVSNAGRTISLQSELPSIGADVVIDGTTQPGPAFGISSAKIKLSLDHFVLQNFSFLFIENANNVAVYGLFFSYYNGSGNKNLIFGIALKDSHHVAIGAKNKGNVFNALGSCITNLYDGNSNADQSNNISVKGNLIGVTIAGGNAGYNQPWIGIELQRIYNLEIGGMDPGERNYMSATANDIDAHYYNPGIPGTFFIKLYNNYIGVDASGSTAIDGGRLGSVSLSGFEYGRSDVDSNITKTEIVNNLMSCTYARNQVLLHSLLHKVKVTGNKIGTDVTGTRKIGFFNSSGILVQNCNKVLVGGDDPSEKNYLAGSDYAAVGSFNTRGLLITKNSMFCNSYGIKINSYPGIAPFVTIDTYSNSLISGKANPNARIELFQNHDCYGNCQGKTYIASVLADNSGNWSYGGTQTAAMVVTATTADSATSEFPLPEIAADNPKIVNPSCGRNNGSITGIKIIKGSNIKWLGPSGIVNTTDTNLTNIGPGTYTLYVSFGENGCSVNTNSFTLANVELPANVVSGITNTSCGKFNGNISLSTNFSGANTRWTNVNGDSLGTGLQINNIGAGTYFFKAQLLVDKSCEKQYGPFIVINNGGPTVDISSVIIQASSCWQTNGSITNVQVSNVTGTAIYNWVDSAGKLVSTTADLLNINAGKYRLKFKDGSGCDTIITSFISIPASGVILFDSTQKIITPSGCSAATGAILQVKAVNAVTYEWINVSTQAVVNSTPDLLNVSSGFYKLIAVSNLGCRDTTKSFFVPPAQPIKLTAALTIVDEHCSKGDGTIQVNSITPGTTGQNFEWLNDNSQLLTNNLTLANLHAGKYYLFATDGNGCRQFVTEAGIKNQHGPLVNDAVAVINPEICSLKNGKVMNVLVEASSPVTYTWYNQNNQPVNTTSNLTNIEAGSYYLIAADKSGCKDTSRVFEVSLQNITPVKPVYITSHTILKGTSVVLQSSNPQDGIYKIFGSKQSSTALGSNSNGIFTVGPLNNDTTIFISYSKGSCQSELTRIDIKAVPYIPFKMPNAFTPHTDGANELFRVKYPQTIKKMQMMIYNRWGVKIFETTDVLSGWNGKLNGVDQPNGTYVWIITYEDILGNRKSENGSVILIR